ncbi:MAG: putative rane protein [Myxococcaceae bacterium]|nr:putative rane protein [Myxococcaceae bacterium]
MLRGLALCVLAWLVGVGALPTPGAALGPGSGIEVRRVQVGVAAAASSSETGPRARAAERLAWEVRKRTSIETVLEPSVTRFDDPSIFRTPLLYWSSDHGFPPLSERELTGLRRFVEYGGFVIIDDASGDASSFDASVRRDLARAFPSERLERLPSTQTIWRSFYLLDGTEPLEAVMHAGRAAVVYSRQDLGAQWVSEDRLESAFSRAYRGSEQRERAIRLGVNLVMYALCLDYKDDQVHAPFILRRRAGRP